MNLKNYGRIQHQGFDEEKGEWVDTWVEWRNLYYTQFDVLVKVPGGTIKKSGNTQTIRSFFEKLKFPMGKATIEIQETIAEPGYKWNTTKYIIEVEKMRDGRIQVLNGDGIAKLVKHWRSSGEVEETIHISPVNEKKVKDYKGTPDPKTYFELQIKNENVYNPYIHLDNSAVFNIKLEKDGLQKLNVNRGTDRRHVTACVGGIGEEGDLLFRIKQVVAPLHHILNDQEYILGLRRDSNTEKIVLNEGITTKGLEVQIDNTNHIVRITIKNEPADIMVGINKVDSQDSSIRLANAAFRMGIYRDSGDHGDIRTYGYGVTDDTGTALITANTYVTSGTALYYVSEVAAPYGYEGAGTIGIYIATDKDGNVTGASTVEDSNRFSKGMCTIKQIKGRYIELEVKNNRQPGPTYQFEINKLNEYNHYEKISGAQFNVHITQEKGANIATNITTSGGYGSVYGLNGQGKIKIEVQEVNAANGYELDSTTRTIYVDREITQEITPEGGNRYYKRLVLDEENTDKGLIISVDNTNQKITLTMTNKPIAGIDIEKVDINDEDIKLQGAEFEVYEGDKKLGTVTTDSWGRAYQYFGTTPANQIIEYTIREVKAPTGYKKIGEDIKVKVWYDSRGMISNVQVAGGEKRAFLDDSNEHGYIRIKINNGEVEPKDDSVSLSIQKYGAGNANLKVQNIPFQIQTVSEDNKRISAIKVTDNTGRINLNGIPGEGKITITIQEISTTGIFETDGEPKVITIEKDKKTKEIKLIKSETTEKLELQVDEKNRKVDLRFNNEVATQVIAIVKEDIEDELLLLDAEYEIVDVETNMIYKVATGNGAGFIGLPLKDKGTYTYWIREIKAPNGYLLNNQVIEIQVTYKELGEIEKVEIIQGGDIARIDNQSSKYIELHVQNEPEDSDIDSYDIKIVKVDVDDLNITLPDAELKIDVTNQFGMTSVSKTAVTDSNGEIWIKNIKGTGDISIDITEIVPPPGRKYDTKQKQANITRDTKTGRLKLIESVNVDTVIDNKNKLVTILVRNEPEDGLYQLVVTKKDKNSQITLNNVEMKIRLPGEKDARTVVTDAQGRIELTNLVMPVAKEYEYTIEEIKTPQGYRKIDKPIKFKVKFEQDNSITKITNAKITSNGEMAAITSVKDNYIGIEVYNEIDEDSQNLYQIKVKKVDADRKDIGIAGVKLSIKIVQNNGDIKYTEGITNEKGEIIIDKIPLTDNGKVIIEEKEAVKGYDLDTMPKEIEYVLENGNIVLQKIQEGLEAHANEKTLEVTLGNKANNEICDLHLEKFLSKINNQQMTDTVPEVIVQDDGSVTYKKNEVVKSVKYNDIVEYTIRVYNSGLEAGYATYILDKVPEGLEFVENNETNNKYGWKKVENGYQTAYLMSGEENEIKGFNKDEMETPDYREVKIVFKVIEKTEGSVSLTKNVATVEDKEEETGKYPEDNENDTEINIEYFKTKTTKYINSVKVNGKDMPIDMDSTKAGKMIKIELAAKQIAKSTMKINYTIEYKNVGTKAGLVTRVLDYIPAGLEFVAEDNPGWEYKDGIATYQINEELAPGETGSKTIVLTWRGSKEQLGQMNNIAITAGEDVVNGEEGTSKMIVEVQKGKAIQYTFLTTFVLLTLTGGIYAIKKYVL